MGRKRLTQGLLGACPTPTSAQTIAKVQGPKGQNLHEVCLPNGDLTLCELPTRFRSLVWVKRGRFLVQRRRCDDDDPCSFSMGSRKCTFHASDDMCRVLGL
jgi:hypothetical protein